jgi:hypothetical protein
MSGNRHIFLKGLQAGLLLSLIVVVFLAARSFAPLQQGAAAAHRLVIAATAASNDFVGLGIILAGAGLFVLSDRRRRARGRQASS